MMICPKNNATLQLKRFRHLLTRSGEFNEDFTLFFTLPGNFYVCDLAGNRVSADEAKRLIREALVGAVPAGASIGATMGSGPTGGGSNPPAVTPNNTPANGLRNKLVRIVNMARPDLRINIEKGPLSLDQINDGAWSAHWELKPTSTGTYLIKNRCQKTGQSLFFDNGIGFFRAAGNDGHGLVVLFPVQ